MGSPFTQLYVHLVWATQERMPLLTPEVEPPLYSALSAVCADLKCRLLAVGSVEDHIHLLVQLHPTISVAELVKRLKGNTSHLLNKVVIPDQGFKWQGAYGAFSVSVRGVKAATEYCRQQKEHHRQGQTYAEVERWEVPGSSPG